MLLLRLLTISFLLWTGISFAQNSGTKPSFQSGSENVSSKSEKKQKKSKGKSPGQKNLMKNLQRYYEGEKWGRKVIIKTGVGFFQPISYFDANYKWDNPLSIQIIGLNFLMSDRLSFGLGIMVHGDESGYSDDTYYYACDATDTYFTMVLTQYFPMNTENFRPYVKAGLNYVVTDSDYKQYVGKDRSGELKFYKNKSDVFAGWLLMAGGEYTFNDWLGMYLETGYGPTILNSGFVLRF